MHLYQSDGKRKVWRSHAAAGDLKHTRFAVKHGACMAARETGSLVFVGVVIADKCQDEF